jgi:hypothetical protein
MGTSSKGGNLLSVFNNSSQHHNSYGNSYCNCFGSWFLEERYIPDDANMMSQTQYAKVWHSLISVRFVSNTLPYSRIFSTVTVSFYQSFPASAFLSEHNILASPQSFLNLASMFSLVLCKA